MLRRRLAGSLEMVGKNGEIFRRMAGETPIWCQNNENDHNGRPMRLVSVFNARFVPSIY